MKKSNNISLAKVGMSRDTSYDLLQKQNYTFAINMNIESEGGDLFKLKSEHSNLLASKFKSGFKFIGGEINRVSGDTYIFLANPTTGNSEFGIIQDNHNLTSVEDLEVECKDCEYKNVLGEPLENITQTESQKYITLLEDSCPEANQCLNLNIHHPIKKIVIKNEQNGTKIFFSDNYNPPRYIDLSQLDSYQKEGVIVCGLDNTTPTCVNCDKLLMFPTHEPLWISPESLVLGGNLKLGEYSFYGAYSDRIGNEMSEYTSVTNPIAIFDLNNRILNDEEATLRTSSAIKIAVDKIDVKFAFYKIVVAIKNIIDGGVRYYEVGMFPTTVSSVLFTTEAGKKELSLNDILVPRPNINLLEGLTESNDYLFGYGVTVEKEWNLQPIASLLGGFMKWQSHIGGEALYADGVNAAKYKGYMRDEVYPLAISFRTNTGYRTARFPLIAPPPTQTALEEVVTVVDDEAVYSNVDVESTSESKGACDELLRTKRWEFYNTAVQLGTYSLEGLDTNSIVEPITKVCAIYNAQPNNGALPPNTTPGSFTIYDIDEFSSVIDFIEDNQFCTDTYDFCDYTNPTAYDNCTPNFNTNVVSTNRIIVGKTYEIITSGTTSFISIGATSNIPGTIFTATNTTTGTGTAALQSCTAAVLDQEYIKVNEILGLETDFIEFTFPEDYPILKGAANCDVFKRDDSGDLQQDEDFEVAYQDGTVRVRSAAFGNTNVASADRLQVVHDTSSALGLCYTHNYYGGSTLDTVQFPQFTTVADLPNKFSDKVHKESLWFFIDLDNINDSVFELTKRLKTNSYSKADDVSPSNLFRVSIFDSRGGGTAIYSKILDNLSDNLQLKIHYRTSIAQDIAAVDIVKGETYEIVSAGTTDFTTIGAADNNPGTIFTATKVGVGTGTVSLKNLVIQDDEANPAINVETTGRKLYIAVDTAYAVVESPATQIGSYYITAPQYGYSVGLQEVQYLQIDVNYDGLILDKFQRYVSECEFDIPIVDSCNAIPLAYGEFGYWESTSNYPDNTELYDSSNLIINETEFLTPELREEFKSKYSTGLNSEGNYILKADTNFVCKPIRHYKFPDNKVSSFINSNPLPSFTESTIAPLGITIDETVINSFLNVAVKNGLITQEQRDSIVEYEIFRGDRTLSKSIIAKGLLYDMYKYTEEDKDILFSNFPYNDLGDNNLFTENEDSEVDIKHPFGGEENYNFMFHSPDTEYYKPALPSELKVEGYAYGNSKGTFNEVKTHPKYTILGREAKKLASTLATLEVIAEATVIAAQSAEVFRVDAGFVFSINVPGAILNILSVAANVIGSAVFKYGRYKYQWLQTFRDLGDPENFAQYYTSVGDYNYLQPYQEEGNLIRGVNKSSYLKSGRYNITNEIGGEKLNVNHVDRESGVFLTFGADYPLEYPETYYSHDNSNLSGGLNSRFIASQTNQCSKGKSKEYVKNIASPYVALKTYIPSQYGELDNISWITTSHKGDLTEARTINTNIGIFGGDIFISRHTLKRKIPLFLDSAMGLTSLTPFAYQAYSNLGTGIKYYANFYSPNKVTLDRGMPNLSTEHSFDCLTGSRDFYVKRPSKFYLYYYGISNFLTETTINTNFRMGKAEYKKQFYPLIEDYEDWTQESKVSIREVNYNYYSNTYSSNTLPSLGRTLPYTYSKEIYDNLYDSPNGVIYSLPDTSEKDLSEPWLVFKPGNKYEFPTAYGKLKELRGVESAQVLGRFESTTALFNALDTMVDGISQDTAQLGTGGIFRQRPITFSNTDLGFAGTQSFQMVSTEYGHFAADAKRGQVFQMSVGGGKPDLKEISSDIGGKGVGMRNWFKQNLPFKILDRSIDGYENIDIDNPYNGVGIAMGWDSRFKRIFLTKKDYKPLQPMCFKDGKYYAAESQAIIDATELEGWTYLGVEECEMKFSKVVGETTEYLFLGAQGSTTTCPEGYVYNETTEICEKYVAIQPQCPEGYTYNQTTKLCELVEVVDAYCEGDEVSCGGSVSANGTEGIYEVTAVVGEDLGEVIVTFDSVSVPDRFQIIWDGNVVADTLFIGDSLPNATYESEIDAATTMDKFLWDGAAFQPNGTEAVDFTDPTDIAQSTDTRAVPTPGQIGVVEDYPTPASPASDGNAKLAFNKDAALPATITLKVYGISGTAWNITNLECPNLLN